jgi:hypothetical protein
MIINMIYVYSRPVFGGAVLNVVLCKNYSVLCVLEQHRGSLSAGPNCEQLFQLAYGRPYVSYNCCC